MIAHAFVLSVRAGESLGCGTGHRERVARKSHVILGDDGPRGGGGHDSDTWNLVFADSRVPVDAPIVPLGTGAGERREYVIARRMGITE